MRIAFVFPGQGSQSVGMLSGFAGNETVAGVMARADEALGFSLTGLIAEGPAETLSLTVNTQPAMLASSVAFYEAWLAAGGEPRFIEGDRRGEHRRLGVDRERKRFGGAFGNEAGERKAERLVGAGHHAGDGLVAGKARQHADALAALAGKHECNAHRTGPMG